VGFVIDSSVLVAVERAQVDPIRLRSRWAGEPLALAAISASELLEGVHRANSEVRRIAREAFVENVLQSVRVVPFDLTIARVHARLKARIPRNRQIGAHDLLIGATAAALGYRVLTRDRRSFPRIPGLEIAVA
jgi:predicted nucleic acid-binding protein